MYANAQSNSKKYDKFIVTLLKNYELSFNSNNTNYFEVLNSTANRTFNLKDSSFLSILLELETTLKVNEEVALDTLFKSKFSVLKKHLWDPTLNIYTNEQKVLLTFDSYMCSCISKKINKNYLTEQSIKDFQECSSNLSKDINYITDIRKAAGNMNINSILTNKTIPIISVYENCDIINYRFNNAIYRSEVKEKYYTEIARMKKNQGLNVLKYFRLKQYDSLKIIFPDYKKYKVELNKIISKINADTSIEVRPFYMYHMNNNLISIVLIKNDAVTDNISMSLTSKYYNSLVNSIKITTNDLPVKDEEIMEVRELKQ